MNKNKIETTLKARLDKFSEDKGYTRNRYRTSELVYCLRKAYIQRKYNILTSLNKFLIQGLLMHDKFPDFAKGLPWFRKARYEVKCNTKHEGFEISGRADIVTKTTIYELKHAKIRDSDLCPAQYALQANAYANALKKKKWRVIVIDNNNLNIKIFEDHASTSEYKLFLGRAKQLHEALENNGKVPDGPDFEWECWFCDQRIKEICNKKLVR